MYSFPKGYRTVDQVSDVALSWTFCFYHVNLFNKLLHELNKDFNVAADVSETLFNFEMFVS